MIKGIRLPLVLAVCVTFSGGCGADSDRAVNVAGMPADSPVEGFRSELLETAFQAASAMPLKPHIKNRSRAQERVVAAALKLDQPRRALRYTEQIANWRKGVGYGDLALYLAQKGYTSELGRYIRLAGEIAELAESWRRDRIRSRIASLHTWLGNPEEAGIYEAGLEASESGGIESAKVRMDGMASFDERVRILDEVIQKEIFDATKNALWNYVLLYHEVYADAQKRALVEDRIKSGWKPMPLIIRLDLTLALVEEALKADDRDNALRLVDLAQEILDSAEWPAENHVPMMARLAACRFRAGDAERARGDADQALALFEAEKETIVNIFRAEALLPLAEAYFVMGRTSDALKVYKLALDQAVINPNSRPRAEDLSETCLSMALSGVNPDEELGNKIIKIKEELGEPW